MTMKIMGIAVGVVLAFQVAVADFNPYTLEWNTPGKDSRDSMPIGNGDIGANIWVEQNGDIVFYISKTDAWSEYGRLLKIGKVRVKIEPAPLADGSEFSQVLSLRDGTIVLKYHNGERLVNVRFWIDANAPVIHLDADSNVALKLRATTEPWRVKRRQITTRQERHSALGFDGDIFVEPDTVLSNRSDDVVWYHSNKLSVWKSNLDWQSLEKYTDTKDDPLLRRTFGALLRGDGMKPTSPTTIESETAAKKVSLQIAVSTLADGSQEEWLSGVEKIAHKTALKNLKNVYEAHKAWWGEFWDRSYIRVSGTPEAEKVTRAYVLQRWVNACGGRGNFPIKFNGSIFTVEGSDRGAKMDADYRRWGGMYWWQNTRLPYWSMIESGDFDLMMPVFRMYLKSLPLRKAAAKTYYGHDGAFYLETQYFWGTFGNEDYGTKRTRSKRLPPGQARSSYVRFYWSGGLEFSLLMLDYYHFTGDKKFARKFLMPLASEILTFFDQHWPRGDDGKILFEPAQALETFQVAVNPLPIIVGVQKIGKEMLALPEDLTTEAQRASWKKLLADLPVVPEIEVDGKKLFAPAHKINRASNAENPELYGIFPYREHMIGTPFLDEALRTFAVRKHKGSRGWQQNAIQAAMLGLTDAAKKMVIENSVNYRAHGFKFPAFWGPNFDWIPDQDHGNVMMIALQRMVMLYDGNEIYLLPAWPKDWDLEFKLHAPGKTIVSGVVKSGKLVKWSIKPPKRKKNVTVMFPVAEADHSDGK